MDSYGDEPCLLCSASSSRCDCDGLPWSSSMFPVQEPLFTFEDQKPAELDELARCMLSGGGVLEYPFEHRELEIDDALVWLGSGTLHPSVAADAITPPPDSSSSIRYGDIVPVSSDWDSLPWTDTIPSPSRLEDVTVGPYSHLLYRDYHDHPRVGGGVHQGTVIAEYDIRFSAETTTRNRPPTPHPCSELFAERILCTDMGKSPQNHQHFPEMSKMGMNHPLKRYRDDCSDSGRCAIDKNGAVEPTDSLSQDICVHSTQELDIGGLVGGLKVTTTKCEEIGRHNSFTPQSQREDSSINSDTSDSQRDTEPTSPSYSVDHKDPEGSTKDASNEIEDPEPKKPYRKTLNKPSSTFTQITLDKYMKVKRHRLNVESSPPSKKRKLNRSMPHKPSVNNYSSKHVYQAKEPASLRRAQSLRSEVSLCSDTSESEDSQRTPIPQARLETKSSATSFPSTEPSTPLPDSADYARSKADPLSRTIAIYCHSSQTDSEKETAAVPIIAPPPYSMPTIVRCKEDEAVDRLRCLLLRERAERERDGLGIHDERRARTLKPERSLSRRDTASTTDSSDNANQWEEESTCSGTEDTVMKDTMVNILSQNRHINRKAWSDSFGISDDFRRSMISWIIEVLPDTPRPGYATELYDQLKYLPQTRFHAVHMLYRYFLRPQKAEFWKRFRVLVEREYLEEDGWNLALASIALSHKLHRDFLPPLEPIYTCEFLQIAPLSWMDPETIERSQRDIFRTLDFTLGSCTPQDVLDELWNALPTLRTVVNQIRRGWTIVQHDTWDKLFKALIEPDVMQYPVTLLTTTALIDSLTSALALQFKTEAEDVAPGVCRCKSSPEPRIHERAARGVEPTSWQIYTFEAMQLMEGVILDVKDVLQLSDMELDDCRKWFSYIGQD